MTQFNPYDSQLFVSNQLPHNFLAEKMILSCLLVSEEARENTFPLIKSEIFYFKNHQELYKTLLLMNEKQIKIDPLTISPFLQENGLLEKIGGVKVIVDLVSQIPNLLYLQEYIDLVHEKFIRRCLIQLGYKMMLSGYTMNTCLDSMLKNFEYELITLGEGEDEQQMISGAELLNELFFELKEKSIKPSLTGLASGFYDLDALIQGFQKSDLIILAGRPSTGKTALSLNIVLNIIQNYQLPVVFFSLEMSKEQIMYRLLSLETNIDQMNLKSGKLSHTDWLQLNQVIKIVAKFPLFIDDTPNLTIQKIQTRLKTILLEQNQLGLVVIDYLQLMESSSFQSETRVQELSQITRSLKILAREFNIPIITLSQLSRNVETRIDKKPILSDLRESGSIEQDADLVLMLYKNIVSSPDSNSLELIVAKQRNGPTGSITLQFDERKTKFYSS